MSDSEEESNRSNSRVESENEEESENKSEDDEEEEDQSQQSENDSNDSDNEKSENNSDDDNNSTKTKELSITNTAKIDITPFSTKNSFKSINNTSNLDKSRVLPILSEINESLDDLSKTLSTKIPSFNKNERSRTIHKEYKEEIHSPLSKFSDNREDFFPIKQQPKNTEDKDLNQSINSNKSNYFKNNDYYNSLKKEKSNNFLRTPQDLYSYKDRIDSNYTKIFQKPQYFQETNKYNESNLKNKSNYNIRTQRPKNVNQAIDILLEK